MEESLQRMQKEFKKNRTAAFVLIGILVLGMIFAMMRNMPLSLFFVVMALAYQMVVLRIMGKRYEKKNECNFSGYVFVFRPCFFFLPVRRCRIIIFCKFRKRRN